MSVLPLLKDLGQVRRAWPAAAGSLTFEQLDEQGRVRAGVITASGEVSLAPYGMDAKLPSLRPTHGLVVHRLGKRAVVIDPARGVASKHLRPGKAAAVAATSRAVGQVAEGTGLTVPSVRAVTDTNVDLALVPGHTLLDSGDAGLPGWEALGRLWPGFVAAGATLSLPAHSRGDEVAVLRHWVSAATAYNALGDHQGALAGAVDTACAALMAGRADPAMLLHRDLHDKQVLWEKTTGSLAALDLDTCALGEGALDCGNLLAHIELRGFQGIYSAPIRAAAARVVTTMAGQLGITPERLDAYTQAARLRLACVYAFRPSASGWLGAWCEHTLTY